MSRPIFPLLALAALTLSACAGGDAPKVPEQTSVVGDERITAFNARLSPDGKRLAWGQAIAGQARIHVGGADGSKPVVLSKGTWDSDPHWSPDGRWIAFAGESPSNDVWVVAADGGEPRLLTTGPARDFPQGWLPDGSGVVFTREGAGAVQTFVAPLDSGAPIRPLVAALGGNQWSVPSPDGSRVLIELSRGGQSTLWVQDMAGGAARQITREGFEAGRPSRASWSPDGRSVVYTSRRTGTTDLWIANVESGELRQLTNDVRNDFSHSWSPDGKWIAFGSDRGGQQDIWIVSVQGGDALRVTDDLAAEDLAVWAPDGRTLYFGRTEYVGRIGVTGAGSEPQILVEWPGYTVGQVQVTVSPDEKTVLFAGNRGGNLDIWSVPLAGGEATPFAAGPLDEGFPQYSPDGSQVAFFSNRSGSADIFVMPAAGGEPRRLTDWPSNEGVPRWSPDGSQIAFVSDRESVQTDFWVVPAAGGTPRRVTSLNQSAVGVASWSPDGKHLYIQTADESGGLLWEVPLTGGEPRRLQGGSASWAGLGALSPDGTRYAAPRLEGGWALMEVTPIAGGAPQRIARRAERIWQPIGIWSLDGSKIAVADWQFTDDPSMNIVELAMNDTTTRIVTTIPRSVETPEAYLRDGRIVFTAQGTTFGIVKVSVAKLLGLP